MDYINPFQPIRKQNTQIVNVPEKTRSNQQKFPKKKRSERSDKTHNAKFPVTPIEHMKLKSYCKQAKRLYVQEGKESLTQTKFNNILLRFGLKNQHLISWDNDYTDTKVYMHTNILKTEFIEIGGPHGLAVRKNLSERKVVYHIIVSVIKWLEGEGSLEKIL